MADQEVASRTVRVRLAPEYCRAGVWWLDKIYLPFMAQQWRLIRQKTSVRQGVVLPDELALIVRNISHASSLITEFREMGRSKLKNPDPQRTIAKQLVAWFGAMPDAAAIGQAPPVFPYDLYDEGAFPDISQNNIDDVGPQILRGIAYDAMLICNSAVHRKVGRPVEHRTVEMVRDLKSISDEVDGRYRRRLKSRAKKFDEWSIRMRALVSRGSFGRQSDI